MARLNKKLVVTTFVFALAGCETTDAPINADYGASVNGANNLQIVNAAATPGAPTPNAKKTQDAIQRYLDDAVKELEEIEDE